MADEMTIEYAREFLDAAAITDRKTLRARYKKLLKKYHPDQYQENNVFYTIMTRKINHAYHLLLDHITQADNDPSPTCTNRPPHSPHSPNSDEREHRNESPHSAATHGAATPRAASPKTATSSGTPPPKEDHARGNADADPRGNADAEREQLRGLDRRYPLHIDSAYRPYVNAAREAICHYYSYNLSNIHSQDHSNSRTHFKVVQNKLSTLLQKLHRRISHSRDHQGDINYYFMFCQAFFDNMQIEPLVGIPPNKTTYRLLTIYRECARILDTAVESRYCNPLGGARMPSVEELIQIRYNLQQLTNEDERLGFYEASTIKHTLTDTFLKTLHWEYRA